MMYTPKISVIIPVYKAENYLEQGLDTILAQSFTDWECLLVDDGSPDGSGRICDEYAAKDTRFRVFHKTNGGVSSARNLGLDYAQGEWISFIDADDFISNNYFNAIENSTVDIVFTESKKFFPETNECVKVFSRPMQNISDSDEYKKVLSKYVTNLAFRTPWGKFIKRSIIGDTRFVTGQIIGEDTIFVYNIYKNAVSIQFYSQSTYYYRDTDIPYYIKYQLDITTCILYLSRIYDAYKNSGASNPRFESFLLFMFFKTLNKEELSKAPQNWFSASLIKKLEQNALPKWSLRKKFQYLIWKKPQLVKIHFSILGFLRKIK